MHEDQLSPELGRLIDAAKAAAAEAATVEAGRLLRAEGAAVLDEDGAVHVGRAGGYRAGLGCGAVEAALAAARQAGGKPPVAAALAVANDPSDSPLPCEGCRRLLAEVDPHLPTVVKQKGRWVVLPLSELEPPS